MFLLKKSIIFSFFLFFLLVRCSWNTNHNSMNKYCTCDIITRSFYIYYPIFEENFFFSRRFFRKCSPYIWLVFKSGLWCHAYSIRLMLMLCFFFIGCLTKKPNSITSGFLILKIHWKVNKTLRSVWLQFVLAKIVFENLWYLSSFLA